MAYPELPPSPTFWRCPKCGTETLFRASGTAHIECIKCAQVSTAEALLLAHASAHPESATETAPAH